MTSQKRRPAPPENHTRARVVARRGATAAAGREKSARLSKSGWGISGPLQQLCSVPGSSRESLRKAFVSSRVQPTHTITHREISSTALGPRLASGQKHRAESGRGDHSWPSAPPKETCQFQLSHPARQRKQEQEEHQQCPLQLPSHSRPRERQALIRLAAVRPSVVKSEVSIKTI
ncbi:uncharacterized protein LOC131184737 isoform X2 [Ahaetulla prasina]|uniref:uncharacterized protein LOC131184737 isoform X2 n=1 Tax=Ahaetulla prasina TaxID=499056 RepID=UPI0026495899|nr:uncharacterized protein LOC131184737 isoform X2 [Ahaetulla prasina]